MASSKGLELEGLQTVLNNIDLADDTVRVQGLGELLREGSEVIDHTEPYVPFDLGNLVGSGYAEPGSVNDKPLYVEIGYGGQAVDYAEAQHEEETWEHEPPTQAKFLKRGIEERQPGMADRIADGIKRRLEQLL